MRARAPGAERRRIARVLLCAGTVLWTAMQPGTGILYASFDRIAVQPRETRQRDTAGQSTARRDIKGSALDWMQVPALVHAFQPVPAGRRSIRDISALAVEDLRGVTWTAADLRGRVTLIDVWATWCAPCLAELPYLKRAYARYSREQFEILGISFDVSDRRTFVSWTNRHGLSWPQAFDGRGRHGPVARQLRVVGVPTSFLVDRDGRVVAMNLRGERLLAAIAGLVG